MVWNKTYGSYGDDVGFSVVQTSDGGYAIAGHTDWPADQVYLVKTFVNGTMDWEKTYGGTSSDGAYSVVQTTDGGYAIAGYTDSFAPFRQMYLVKTSADGTMAWNKTYGGASVDWGESVVETSDGGYAIAGEKDAYGVNGGDFWLIKTDFAGNAQWNKTYGGTGREYTESMIQTSDGGYAIAGWTKSYGVGTPSYTNVYLVKVKSWTNVEHQRNLGSRMGLTLTALTNTTISLHRGETDADWNYLRVRIWLIKEPTWIYGDINMDGIVDAKDLYIVGRNYGKTFSLLSLTGIVAIAGIRTVKKRRQPKQPSYIS
jgi:hypothetical protein